MAKRGADTYITKDGPSESAGWGAGEGTGPTKATAAQMAARRLAQPRGLRPGQGRNLARPKPAPIGGGGPSQIQQQSFPPPAFGQTNGAQQQQGFSFGQQQPNGGQASQSFPPFGNNTNNNEANTNSTFAPPSGGFNFSASGQGQPFNNPFAAAFSSSPAQDNPNTNGQIFGGGALSQQQQQPPNIFGQQQPQNTNLFGQSSTPQQQTSTPSIFGQNAGQQQAAPNLFGQDKQQPQSVFSNSNSFSQPPQLPTVSLFGAQFGGASQPTQPNTSIFTSTNGTNGSQATTGLFGSFSTPRNEPQHDQTQAMDTDSEPVTAGPPAGGNIFGQAPAPSNQDNNTQQQSGLFAHLSDEKPATNIFAPSSQPQQASPNIFGQIAKSPSAEPQQPPFSNLFNNAATSTTSTASNSSIFASPQKPSQTQPDDMSTTPDNSPQKPISHNIFGSVSQTKDASKPLGNSLFDRISKPPTTSESTVPSASVTSNTGSGQPNMFAKSLNPFGMTSQSGLTPAAQNATDESSTKNKALDISNPPQSTNEQSPASMPNTSPKKMAQGNPFSSLGSRKGSDEQQHASTNTRSPDKIGLTGGLFGTITNNTNQAPENALKTAPSAQDTSINIFANPSGGSSSTANKFSSALFPSNIEKTASTMFKPPATSSNSSSSETLHINGNLQQTSGSQRAGQPSRDTALVKVSDSPSDFSPSGRRYGEPPEPPSDFTDLEKTQLVTGWRLKSLDVAMQAHRQRAMSTQDRKLLVRFYEERKQQILAANGGPMNSGKRKHLEENASSDYGSKRARAGQEDHLFTNPSKNDQRSEDAVPSQGTFKPASTLANGFTTSPNKRKAEDEAGRDREQAEKSPDKRARGIDAGGQVSYPSLSSFTGDSQTSSLFQSVMGKAKSVTSEVKGNDDIVQHAPQQSTSRPSLFQAAVPKSTTPSSTSNLFTFGPAKNTFDDISKEKSANGSSLQPPHQQEPGSTSLFKAPITNSNNAPAATSSNSLFTPASSTRPSNATSDPKPAVPMFGKVTNGPVNFMGQFGASSGDAGKRAVEQAKNAKMERVKDDEWDEDEETEKQWEQRYWKELKEKEEKALGAAAKLKPTLVGGKWVFPTADETNAEQTSSSDSATMPSQPASDLNEGDKPAESNAAHATTASGGLWGRVTKPDGTTIGGTLTDDIQKDRIQNAAPSQGLQQGFNLIGQTPGSTAFTGFKPSQNSLFGDKADISKRKAVDEIDRDDQSNPGKRVRGTDGEATSGVVDQFSPAKTNITNPSPPKPSLFGSSQNPFGTLGGFTPQSSPNKFGTSPGSGQQGDHTWKPETPIKFGDSKTASGPPNVNITSPSPTKSPTPFGSLFGNAKTDKPPGSLFQSAPNSAAVPTSTAGFSFGVSPLKPTASLAPPTGGFSPLNGGSRSNSPGLTTGESANEATGDEAEGQEGQDEQVNLTSVGAGPDEEVVFEVKSKAHRWNKQAKGQPGWEVHGVGPFRILKNGKTGTSRVLMRQDPSGRVLMNQPIIRDAKYKASSKTTFTMLVFIDAATIESYSVKVGKDSDAQKIVDTLNAAIKEPDSVNAEA